MPLGEVEAQLAQMRARIAVGAAVGCAVALLLGLFVARRITNPIVGITQAAEAMRAGDYESRVRHLPADEIGILGDTLNRMAAEVRRKFDAISDDDAQLRAVLEGMVESVIAVDASDRVVFINGAACRMLGVSESAAVGCGVWELVRLAELEDLLTEVRTSGRASRGDLVLEREGKETRQEVYATPLTVSSKSPGVVIVMHDVTQVRRLESVRRDFVANVSHELKTPLTSIRGYVETLLDGALEDEENNVRFLEKIEAHVVRLNHLVSDLLSLGRIEAQQEELEVAPVDLGELVRDAVRRHERQARGRGLENEVAVLRVRDTGIGIPAEDLDRIFERFYRVDKARSREVGGTGLGLSIVKHLVQAMKGRVTVESRAGEGSCFSVALPLDG